MAADSSRQCLCDRKTTGRLPRHQRRRPKGLWGSTDAFVTKLRSAGSAWNTPPTLEERRGRRHEIAVDSSGNVYVTGQTTALPHDRRRLSKAYWGGLFDAFVTKLNANGRR